MKSAYRFRHCSAVMLSTLALAAVVALASMGGCNSADQPHRGAPSGVTAGEQVDAQQVQIVLKRERLDARGVTTTEVDAAVQRFLDSSGGRFNREQLESVIVGGTKEQPVRLSDVAELRISTEESELPQQP